MSCLKRFLLLSVLLSLLFSLSLSADVCLTDEEFTELNEIFGRLSVTLTEQEKQIETLQTQLQRADESLVTSHEQIEMLRQTLDELKKSLREQRLGAIRIGAVVGVASLTLGVFAGYIYAILR